LLLTQLLAKLRRFRDAIQAFERALEADPELFPAAEIIEKIIGDPAAQHELCRNAAEASGAGPGRIQSARCEKRSRTFRAGDDYIFMRQLGVDPHAAPLVQGLARFPPQAGDAEAEGGEVQSMRS